MLRVLAFALALLTFSSAARAEGTTLYVFAAASLTDALRAAAEAYEREADADVRLVFESSSTLARQIENGAPADLYLSANPRWMDYAAERGLIDRDSRRDLLANGLVLIAPADDAPNGAPIDRSLADPLAGAEALLTANASSPAPTTRRAASTRRTSSRPTATTSTCSSATSITTTLTMAATSTAGVCTSCRCPRWARSNT